MLQSLLSRRAPASAIYQASSRRAGRAARRRRFAAFRRWRIPRGGWRCVARLGGAGRALAPPGTDHRGSQRPGDRDRQAPGREGDAAGDRVPVAPGGRRRSSACRSASRTRSSAASWSPQRRGVAAGPQREQDLAVVYAEHVSVVVTVARASSRCSEAMTDPLTGLANRRVLLDRLQHELVRGDRGGEPVHASCSSTSTASSWSTTRSGTRRRSAARRPSQNRCAALRERGRVRAPRRRRVRGAARSGA